MTHSATFEYVSCDICGSDDWKVLFERGRNHEHVVNVICQQCGLVFVNPRKQQTHIAEFYASGEFSLVARKAPQPSLAKVYESEGFARERFRILRSYLDLRNMRPGRLLEIGCGIGSFLYLMRGAGWEVQGVEPDITYAHAGESEYDISIMPELFEKTSFQESSYDMVAMFHVIEHLSSPHETLALIRNILKPGGTLFLECPCIERPYGGNLEHFFWSAHLFTFSRSTLTGLLRNVGFEPLSTGYTGDFLWVIAQKTDPLSSNEGHYPYDDPALVHHMLLKKYKRFLQQQTLEGQGSSRKQRLSLPQKAVKKLLEQPEDFIPAIFRKTVRASRKSAVQIHRLSSVLRRPSHLKKMAHFGLHSPGNAGDTVLFIAVRDLFDQINGKHFWQLEHLWEEVTEETVKRLNTDCDAIVIGGGGLFLKDTNPNNNSGWQWNCSVENLKHIEKPIVIFAIGYNRFPGQEEFASVFRDHVTELVKRSVFFGLRNYGSIRALKQYIPKDLWTKLRFQPCPTTLLSFIYPRTFPTEQDNYDRHLALNVAFDRHRLRYGRDEYEILGALARAMKWANKQGWAISLAIHSRGDANIIPYLVRERVDFTEVCLEGVPALEVVDFYRQVPLTVGMRGHSQLIPFGVQNAIVSLISHDKLRFFLEDIGHPEWGVEIRNPNLEVQLVEKIQLFDEKRSMIRAQIVQAQKVLWDMTLQNLEMIREALEE